MKKVYTILSMILFVCLTLSVSQADPVPSTINYQGYLGDSYGTPLPDGQYDITFSLHNAQSEGDRLWTETWEGDDQVALINGRFHISLGSISPFNDVNLYFGEQYYLEIEVGNYGKLEPRIKLASYPYTNKAGNIHTMNSLSGGVVGTTDVQTITGKEIAAPTVEGGTIDQAEIGSTTPAEGTFTGISASGSLTISGRILTRTKIEAEAKTAPYHLLQTDDIILADAAGGMISMTLPSATVQPGKTYTVFLTAGDAAPNSTDLFLSPNFGETISGLAQLEMNRAGQSVQVVSDGTNWQVMAEAGNVMAAYASEQVNAPTDNPAYQYVRKCDMILGGSECIGSDCVNGESFGSDTLRLKENNLRIMFEDTSDSASFPGNDWRMTANETSNGGRSYFSIDDVDGNISGIAIENSGNVNIGGNTSSPQGRLQVNNPGNGSGTVKTVHRPLEITGTITSGAEIEEPGSGFLSASTSATTVRGSYTAFTTELVVGCKIRCEGEEKTVTAITSDTLLEVDSAWGSTLSWRKFTIPVTPVTGTDTLFTSELKAGDELIVGDEIRKIYVIHYDTALFTYGSWDAPFTGVASNTTIPILEGTGTLFASGEVNLGDTISIADELKQVTAVNSDTDIQLDSFFETEYDSASYKIIKTEFIVAEDGKAGIGTISPDETFEIEFKPETDVEMAQGETNTAQSVISLRSSNGSKFFINVDNSGNLSGSSVKP